MRSSYALRLLSIAAPFGLLLGTAAQATLVGPVPYTGVPGSPWDGLGLLVEDFEDGALNTPDVSASAGIVLTFGSLRDSVESTPNGYSYYTNGATSLTFTFSGTLPTHAGIAWTDVGCLISEGGACPPVGAGAADVYFEAFDDNNISLGVLGPFLLGDGAANGGTAEDRFFGATNPTGISSFVISMPDSNDWEVDHLTYGTPTLIPEPSTAALCLLGLVGLAVRGRGQRR